MQDTKLAVSQGQEREWVEREQAGGSSSGEGYHFICEVFFMTLQVRQGSDPSCPPACPVHQSINHSINHTCF